MDGVGVGGVGGWVGVGGDRDIIGMLGLTGVLLGGWGLRG